MYGFTLRSSVYRAITGAIASIFAVVPSVSGQLLPCPEVWQGPSPDNTLAECNLFPWAARRFGPPLFIPFIFCVITLILLLFALIGRYCCRCCGSYRRRPTTVCCGGSEWDDRSAESKERMYSSSGVRCVKCSVFLVLVISVLALLLVAVGVYRTGITYGDVWEDADGVIVWASQQVSNILQTLTLANGALAGGLPPDLTTELNNQVNQIRITLDNIRVDTADRIWNPIAIAGYVIATVPFLFFFAALMFACCNVRTCGPLLVILLVWIVGILFCLLGLVFESVHYATDVACAEVRAQVAREPGVFQWYIIPRCNNLDLFTSARQQIAQAELTTSQSACEAMTSYCDASTTYVAPSTIFFTCPYATTFTTACTTADQANRLITMETVVKTSGPITNLCTSVPNSQCTVLLCATDCVDSDLRSQMALVVQRLDEAVRLQTAVQVNIVPLLDCNTIVDQAVAILNECPALMRNSAIIAAGCYVYVLSALCIIILLFLGQKRFFNPDNTGDGTDKEMDDVKGTKDVVEDLSK